MTRLLRLAVLSLLFIYLPVFGLILFYFLDSAPFYKVAAIDPNLTAEEVLDPLDEGRTILRSFPCAESSMARWWTGIAANM